jgi:hypothetical protein
MSTVVLKDEFGEHLGFLLLAGGGPLSDLGSRDCIFSGFPLRAELLACPLSEYVQMRKHIEFLAEIRTDTRNYVIGITCKNSDRVEIKIDLETLKGSWWAAIDGQRLGIGQCELI